MTLQQLKYVVALDIHRHFVKAAAHCFVAQPTLTLQVKKLENEIGFILFDRSFQPLVPTAMGEKFILKARHILRDVKGLKEMVNQHRNHLQGSFRLAIIPTLAPYLLPLFLTSFLEDHPDLYLEVEEMESEQIIKGLHQDTVHIGILATPLSSRHIREIPMFYEPFLVYAHKHHPVLDANYVNQKNLSRDGLFLLKQGHCFRQQMLNICREKKNIQQAHRFSFESGSIEMLKNMVNSYSGYTLIPEMAVEKGKDSPFVRRFVDPEPVREVSLVVYHGFSNELLLTHLRDAIVKNVPHGFTKHKRYNTIGWR